MNFWREAVPVFSPPLHLNLRRQLCLLLLPIQLLTPRGDKLQDRGGQGVKLIRDAVGEREGFVLIDDDND